MAARFDLLTGRQHQQRMLVTGVQSPPLSRDERLARIQRRRRRNATTEFLESFLWVTGAALVAAVAVAGLTGLR